MVKKQAEEENVSRRENDLLWVAHIQLHSMHDKSHELEHSMTSEALNKADSALERRLEGMNEFRAQLDRQTATFLTREIFDSYTKEESNKVEVALTASSDKYDTIIKAMVNRHESDTETLENEIQALKEAFQTQLQTSTSSLEKEIQGEREYRKTFEGSINTWKWLLGFLGASGLAGVIYMFANGGVR